MSFAHPVTSHSDDLRRRVTLEINIRFYRNKTTRRYNSVRATGHRLRYARIRIVSHVPVPNDTFHVVRETSFDSYGFRPRLFLFGRLTFWLYPNGRLSELKRTAFTNLKTQINSTLGLGIRKRHTSDKTWQKTAHFLHRLYIEKSDKIHKTL